MGKTEDVDATVAEIKTVEDAGCDTIRLAMPTLDAAKAIAPIKARTKIPIVADIHFDPRLAIAALDYGADKIRINPGNFFDRSYLEKVVALAAKKGAAMRIGVNAGSLEKDLWEKHGAPTAEALAEYWHRRMREEMNIANEDHAEIREWFHQKYHGGRFSFGYPACPNLEDQAKLFKILPAQKIGIELTEEFHLVPEQSTTAIVVHHPEAKYFIV
jgi:hypothetical protein